MLKLLIADDEIKIREVIREYGKANGYEVYEASDGEEAISMVEKHDFACVILDIMMPNLDGYSACKNIKKIRNVPIIILSARTEESDKLYAFDLGIDDYVTKPFSPRELMARIKVVIDRSGRNTQNANKNDNLTFKNIKVSVPSHTVTIDGKDAHLTNTETGQIHWVFKPINTSSEYIGIRPDVKTADGAYYGTVYAGYNFRFVSPGMIAYYVSNAGGSGFTMEQIESDVIPANTPVIIRCNSANPKDNMIEPVVGGYTLDEVNWLGGVYCSIYVAGHHNVTRFDDISMRILGLSDKGELAFIANPSADRLYKEQYLMANKAYLIVNPNDADVLTVEGTTAINNVKAEGKEPTTIYTLTGNRVTNSATLRPGIYIQKGKKVVIK
jgi:DNA-binding response OmpR family regulator